MTDVLIRNVPDSTLDEIDRQASGMGISRNELLRRWLSRDFRLAVSITSHDLSRLSRLTQDLEDPEIADKAWS